MTIGGEQGDDPSAEYPSGTGQEHAHPGPKRSCKTDGQCEATALQRMGLQLVADDRKLAQRRIDDRSLELRMATQDEPERAHEDEQQGKDRIDPVVGERGGKAPAFVVGVFLPDRDRKGQPRTVPLISVSVGETLASSY